MNKSNTALGASFALLLSAAMVLFQSQSAIPGAGTGAAPGGGSVSLTSTQVAYGDGSNAVTSEAAFAYNATTNVLTVDRVSLSTGSGGALPIAFVNGAGVYGSGCAAGDIAVFAGGGTRHCLGSGDIRAGSNDTTDLGTSGTRYNEVYLGTGGIVVDFTDSTGSPGAATINKTSGSSAIAVGASSVVITNSKAATTSRILITNTETDATCLTTPWVVTKASGSFTVTAPANCTAATNFDWLVVN